MSAHFQYEPVSEATPDETRFSCAVRCGRRRSDAYGHLVLTSTFLEFHGGHDLNVGWSEVAGVTTDDETLIVALRDTGRTLQFDCQTAEAASRAAALVRESLTHRQQAPAHLLA